MPSSAMDPRPNKGRKSRRRSVVVVLVCAVSLFLLGWGVSIWSAWRYTGSDAVWVYIPRGASTGQMADSLSVGMGRTGTLAMRITRILGFSSAKSAGAYRFEPGTSAFAVARAISRGRQTPVRVTFNNIRTLPQLASRLARRLDTDSLAMLAALDSVLAARGYSAPCRIGAVMPDTYEFYWNESPDRVVERLNDHQQMFWTEKRKNKAARLGLTTEQIVVIASIAEEESAAADERGTIGRLYINRLHRGMPLQADPTVKFAVGDFSIRRITGPMLSTPSPYNTYRVSGLPPGPIRMPAASTIDAILDSKAHDYLYMCAKADFSGRHAFTDNYNTHLRNAAAYRAALDRRGIH